MEHGKGLKMGKAVVTYMRGATQMQWSRRPEACAARTNKELPEEENKIPGKRGIARS